MRSVLASLILVVATVTATFAFGVNLQRWTATPRLYGWNWDAAVGTTFGTIPPDFVDGIAHFPGVSEVSALTIGRMAIGGTAVPAIGIDSLRGEVVPRIDAGRLPRTTREIVLGAKTLRAVHAHVGDTVTATIAGKAARLRVVGRTTFPAFGNERGAETGLGTGALGTVARFPAVDPTNPDGRYNFLLVRFAPGAAARGEPELRKALTEEGCDASCFLTDSRPAEIDGYRNVRRLPLTIGIVLVLLLVATLTHVLVSTMRRRSVDLAILRALGCTRRNLVVDAALAERRAHCRRDRDRRSARPDREQRCLECLLVPARHRTRHRDPDRGARRRARPGCSCSRCCWRRSSAGGRAW